jgi:hypothetical protein
MTDAAIDLRQVLREIDEEVQARRASGDFPPGMERDLDLVFARFAPANLSGDDAESLLEAADRASFVDADPPTGSRIPPVAILKRVQHKLLSWYFRYLGQQVTAFAGTVVSLLKVLTRRVEALEATVPGASPAAVDAARGAAAGATAGDLADHVAGLVGSVRGRVLVAEAGDGSLVRVLADRGVDAYGVEPRLELAEAATMQGVEVRDDEALDHLRAVGDGELAAVVLLGCTDRVPLGVQLALLDEVTRVLAAGGRVVVVGTAPAAWGASNPVEADLAAGRPLHAATWVHLLEQRGFTGAAVQEAGDRYAVSADR